MEFAWNFFPSRGWGGDIPWPKWQRGAVRGVSGLRRGAGPQRPLPPASRSELGKDQRTRSPNGAPQAPSHLGVSREEKGKGGRCSQERLQVFSGGGGEGCPWASVAQLWGCSSDVTTPALPAVLAKCRFPFGGSGPFPQRRCLSVHPVLVVRPVPSQHHAWAAEQLSDSPWSVC